MRIRLIRHATLVVEYAGKRLLVDPMLDDAERARRSKTHRIRGTTRWSPCRCPPRT